MQIQIQIKYKCPSSWNESCWHCHHSNVTQKWRTLKSTKQTVKKDPKSLWGKNRNQKHSLRTTNTCLYISYLYHIFYHVCMFQYRYKILYTWPEMQKAVDMADISVLFFSFRQCQFFIPCLHILSLILCHQLNIVINFFH